MKFCIAISALFLLLNCQNNKGKTIEKNDSYSFFVGTYTNAESQGIYKYVLQKDGVLKRLGLVAKLTNPSFLTMSTDNKFLLAVSEIENTGTVESFLVTGDSLKFISRSSSGGAHPCFVTMNDTGFVLTANYTSGNVGLLKLNKKGELSDLLDIQQHTGKGTTERQQEPHAHSTWFEPGGNTIISVDLGTNELWFSHLDSQAQKLLPSNPYKLKMSEGAGPRHLTFHPNGKWIYIVNELNSTVVLVQKSDNGKYKKGIPITTLPTGYTDTNNCADIHISSDGKFVYASNRGHNSIAIYSVDAGDGSLTLIGHQTTLGKGPRNFSLSPNDNYLLVANQHTNNIVSFKRDKITGLLRYMNQIEAPTPVCIVF
ncbi:MAG: lactonase family protein [Bacteroidetes bacterium]|nr:lactonase family protein [Bacteroidota bacterium]